MRRLRLLNGFHMVSVIAILCCTVLSRPTCRCGVVRYRSIRGLVHILDVNKIDSINESSRAIILWSYFVKSIIL